MLLRFWNLKWICLALSEFLKTCFIWQIGCLNQLMNLIRQREENKKKCFAEEHMKEPNHYPKCSQSYQAATAARKGETMIILLSLDQFRWLLEVQEIIMLLLFPAKRWKPQPLATSFTKTKGRRRTLTKSRRSKSKVTKICPTKALVKHQEPRELSQASSLRREGLSMRAQNP